MRLNITCPDSVSGSLLFKFGGSQSFSATSTGDYIDYIRLYDLLLNLANFILI